MVERRHAKRVPTDAILMIQAPDHPDIEKIGFHEILSPTSINLSDSGLQIEGKQELPVGIYLNIFITLPGTKNAAEINGKVIWCKEAERIERYRIGIEFVEFLKKGDKKLIHDYVMQSDS
ncbi:MAG: PilZ domain-containing protein [Spirochaetes bacterium]|nr:PilZ domain-containing protein [Spirochaetota bacterium]